MPRSITLPRLDPAQLIDLDGTSQSPELVLDGIKADDFGDRRRRDTSSSSANNNSQTINSRSFVIRLRETVKTLTM